MVAELPVTSLGQNLQGPPPMTSALRMLGLSPKENEAGELVCIKNRMHIIGEWSLFIGAVKHLEEVFLIGRVSKFSNYMRVGLVHVYVCCLYESGHLKRGGG